jgi:NitT/TauT family transport system substrate-binding protein
MIKRLSLLMWLSVVVVSLTACQSATAQSERQPLRVEYTQWWGDYTAIIAEEKGFFDKHGVEVELVPYEIFSQALPDLAAGKIDVGLFGISDALNVARRVPIKVVAVYDQGGDSTVVAAPDIFSIADLRGKTIGVPAGSTYELFVREMLESAGLSLKDVNLVSIDPETIAQQMPDEVQAGYVWDPYLTQLVNRGSRILYSSQQGKRLFPDVITLRADTAADRPEDVKAFLRAWFEALEYRRAHPEESNAIIAEKTELSIEDVTAGQENILLNNAVDNWATFAAGSSQAATSIHHTAQTNLNYLISIGTASQQIDLNETLDSSYLPEP